VVIISRLQGCFRIGHRRLCFLKLEIDPEGFKTFTQVWLISHIKDSRSTGVCIISQALCFPFPVHEVGEI
jgi:hypothetical protein